MLSIRITDNNSGLDLTIAQAAVPTLEVAQSISVIAPAPSGPITSAPAPLQLEWSRTLCDGERVDHTDAKKACESLGDGWRLPTRVELLSLVDDTRFNPAIDTKQFPDTKSGAYWTGTEYKSDSSYAWIVNFLSGDAYDLLRGGNNAFVRAVRSLPAGQ